MCTLIYVRTENDGAVQNSPPCQMHHCFCSHPNLQIMDGVSGSDCLWQVSLFKHMLTYKNSKMTTCMAIFTVFFFVCVEKSGRTNHCKFSNILFVKKKIKVSCWYVYFAQILTRIERETINENLRKFPPKPWISLKVSKSQKHSS